MRMIAGAIVFHAGVLVLRSSGATSALVFGWPIILAGVVMMLIPEQPRSPSESAR